MSRPEPFSSPDCDLRGLEWMPLNATNLLDSTLFLESTGDEFKAAVALICKSWRQVPAGSLPSNERSLATLAMTENWTAVRTMALRNWVLCSDGRYYHPIVAAKAMETLPKRQEFVEKKSAEAERKTRERHDRKELFAALREAGIVLPAMTSTGELRTRVSQLKDRVTGDQKSRDMSRLGEGHHTTGTVVNSSILSGGASPTPAPSPSPAPTPAPTPAPSPAPAKAKLQKQPRPEGFTSAVWAAYSEAYEAKYQTKPVRNATVNGQLANFVDRIGQAEAPDVARFYLAITDPKYVRDMHPVRLLQHDAESIRTRWATARSEIVSQPSSARAKRAAAALAPLGLRFNVDPPPKENPHVIAG